MVHHYWNVYCTTSENSQLSILCGFCTCQTQDPQHTITFVTPAQTTLHAFSWKFIPVLFLWSLTVVYKASQRLEHGNLTWWHMIKATRNRICRLFSQDYHPNDIRESRIIYRLTLVVNLTCTPGTSRGIL